MEYNKWVACWGNATSITDRKECVYAKDITLRYPMRMVFSGSKLRMRFSNLTGTEPVTISKVVIMHSVQGAMHNHYLMFEGQQTVTIAPGKEVESDELPVDITAGEMITVSIYLGEVTQMNAGTLITGPLSRGQYAYGDYAEAETFPLDLSRKTNWFYFLNNIDIFTEEQNHCVVCYGDSITAQSWPDYLSEQAWQRGQRDVAIIRRAVSGTRILRQYDCITYQAYGLKGATRFPIEMNTAGMSAVIIQHGINDIIHPVGTDVNPFRPWSDMPTVEEMEKGVETIYIDYLRTNYPEVKIYSGTLLPIFGWRTYNEDRDVMRNAFNEWLRSSSLFDACIDFDEAVRGDGSPDSTAVNAFAPGFDSGDHLHPSESAYEAMAAAVTEDLLK